jgi:hypothetical protein
VEHSYQEVARGLAGHHYDMRLELHGNFEDGIWLEQVVDKAELDTSRALWQLAIQLHPDYQPIDWQTDMLSGFRWSAKSRSEQQFARHTGNLGADPIRPMEFGRLLHLPRMALLVQLYPKLRKRVLTECQAQILDFAAANPVGKGIQWACALDVAIRTANLVLTHWLLRAPSIRQSVSRKFEQTLAEIIHRHGMFLRANMRFNAGNTGNHYLGEVTGLLFASNYFSPTHEVLDWEQCALQALQREVPRQFYTDGGHFEGSTSYHGFCTELLVWCLALGHQNRVGVALPDHVYQRAGRALDLLEHVRTPSGGIVQFGDNDSARLFLLIPQGDLLDFASARTRYLHLDGISEHESRAYFDEDVLDYRGVVNLRVEHTTEWQLLSAVAGSDYPSRLRASAVAQPQPSLPREPRLPGKWPHQATTSFPADGDLREGLRISCFPESGVYVARSPRLFLAVSAHTNPAQKLNLSHNHNDKLGVELYLDGRPVLIDPGSYVYTPLPDMRDAFRCSAAHNVPVVEGEEQNRLVDTFLSYPDARCKVLEAGEDYLLLELCYRDIRQQRLIEIERQCVRITDFCNRPFRQNWNALPWISPGYGKLRQQP